MPAVSIGLATILMALTVTGPALAQDEAGLCRVLDIDEVAQMTGQRYESPPFWDLADNCKYLADSDADGNHYVRLHLDGLAPYERYREGSLDPIDLEVAGRPAFAASDDDPRGWLNTQVAVDFGETTLRATIIADAGADPDQLDHTIALAEMAAAQLDAEATSEPEATSAASDVDPDLAPIPLPEVEGVEWRREYEGYGPTALDSDIAPMGIDVLLDAAEADIARFGVRAADVHDAESGDRSGAYLAMRVAGAGRERMEEAALAWIASLLGQAEVAATGRSIADRDVLVVSLPDDMELFVHAADDTVHFVSSSEDVATRILAALP